jgi:hypothetical protein
MTFDELAAVGKECLEEREGTLKIQGVRRFDWIALDVKQRVAVNIERLNPEDIKPAILSVLDRLSEVGNFTMSEPRDLVQGPGIQLANVSHNDLRLSFTYGYGWDAQYYLWIVCWYYPAP